MSLISILVSDKFNIVATDTAVSKQIKDEEKGTIIRIRNKDNFNDKVFKVNNYYVSVLCELKIHEPLKNFIEGYLLTRAMSREDEEELKNIVEKFWDDYKKPFREQNIICQNQSPSVIIIYPNGRVICIERCEKDGDINGFRDSNDFEKYEVVVTEPKQNKLTFAMYGFKNKEATQVFINEFAQNEDIYNMLEKAYNAVVCDEVGGDLLIYMYDKVNDRHFDFRRKLDDKYRVNVDENYYMFVNGKWKADVLELKGINIEDKFIIDEKGKVTINGGSISFNSIEGLDNKLLDIENSIPTLPNYIKSTYIGSTEIRSPEITGGKITGTKIYGGGYYDLDGVGHLTLATNGHYSDLKYRNVKRDYDLLEIRDNADGTVTLWLMGVPIVTARNEYERASLNESVSCTATFG